MLLTGPSPLACCPVRQNALRPCTGIDKKTKNSTPPNRVMELQQSILVSMIEYPAGRRSGKSEQQLF